MQLFQTFQMLSKLMVQILTVKLSFKKDVCCFADAPFTVKAYGKYCILWWCNQGEFSFHAHRVQTSWVYKTPKTQLQQSNSSLDFTAKWQIILPPLRHLTKKICCRRSFPPEVFPLIIRPKEISIDWGHFSQKYVSCLILCWLYWNHKHEESPPISPQTSRPWTGPGRTSRSGAGTQTHTTHTRCDQDNMRSSLFLNVLKEKIDKKLRLSLIIFAKGLIVCVCFCISQDSFKGRLTIQGHRTYTENALFTVWFFSHRGPLTSWNTAGGDLNGSFISRWNSPGSSLDFRIGLTQYFALLKTFLNK